MTKTPSMRRLKADSVPKKFIRKILETGSPPHPAATCQRWRVLVVKDPEVKRTIGGYYKRVAALSTTTRRRRKRARRPKISPVRAVLQVQRVDMTSRLAMSGAKYAFENPRTRALTMPDVSTSTGS
jgi:hypothetical protein